MKRVLSVSMAVIMLLGCSLFLFTGCEKEEEEVITTNLLRVGILSDVHIGPHWGVQQHERFEKALLFYKSKGVDGILITGDLQENTDFSVASNSLEEFVDIWFRVFPDNKNNLTGERVEPMFIYGNHDVGLVDAEYWPERLGTYEDAWIKEIKGYQFVGAHYKREGSELAANLAGRAEALSEDKPFFFAQHQPIKTTILNANEGLLGTGGFMYDVLRKYENCVVFTGHTHIPITDERSIWQSNSKKGAQFTAVNCSTINYAWLESAGLSVNGDADKTQQGLYMIVDGAMVTLERYSFYDMELQYEGDLTTTNVEAAEQIGAPWVFDATQKKNKPYDYETRQLKAEQPVFADDAVLDIGGVGPTTINVFIPPATVGAPDGYSDLVQSYRVEAVDKDTGEVVSTATVATEYHVDIDANRLQSEVFLGLEGLQPNTTYEIRAYALECYQKASEPLIAEVTTKAE